MKERKTMTAKEKMKAALYEDLVPRWTDFCAWESIPGSDKVRLRLTAWPGHKAIAWRKEEEDEVPGLLDQLAQDQLEWLYNEYCS